MDKNNVDTAKELPTVISFCSGYGGIERGLDLAGVEHRVLAYVEIEAFVLQALQLDAQKLLIPPGVLGDAVVRDHQRASLRRRQVVEHDHRHCVEAELLRGGEPSAMGFSANCSATRRSVDVDAGARHVTRRPTTYSSRLGRPRMPR